jgi:hypothetical protein
MTPEVFSSFALSLDRLAQVLKEPKTVVIRDSAIKRFELNTPSSLDAIMRSR